MNTDKKGKIVPVKISDEAEIFVELTNISSGGQDIAFEKYNLENVEKSIIAISEKMANVMAHVKPDKACVEFGIELGVESGKLTSLLVKGEGKGTFKITLEWNKYNR